VVVFLTSSDSCRNILQIGHVINSNLADLVIFVLLIEQLSKPENTSGEQ